MQIQCKSISNPLQIHSRSMEHVWQINCTCLATPWQVHSKSSAHLEQMRSKSIASICNALSCVSIGSRHAASYERYPWYRPMEVYHGFFPWNSPRKPFVQAVRGSLPWNPSKETLRELSVEAFHRKGSLCFPWMFPINIPSVFPGMILVALDGRGCLLLLPWMSFADAAPWLAPCRCFPRMCAVPDGWRLRMTCVCFSWMHPADASSGCVRRMPLVGTALFCMWHVPSRARAAFCNMRPTFWRVPFLSFWQIVRLTFPWCVRRFGTLRGRHRGTLRGR